MITTLIGLWVVCGLWAFYQLNKSTFFTECANSVILKNKAVGIELSDSSIKRAVLITKTVMLLISLLCGLISAVVWLIICEQT